MKFKKCPVTGERIKIQMLPEGFQCEKFEIIPHTGIYRLIQICVDNSAFNRYSKDDVAVYDERLFGDPNRNFEFEPIRMSESYIKQWFKSLAGTVGKTIENEMDLNRYLRDIQFEATALITARSMHIPRKCHPKILFADPNKESIKELVSGVKRARKNGLKKSGTPGRK